MVEQLVSVAIEAGIVQSRSVVFWRRCHAVSDRVFAVGCGFDGSTNCCGRPKRFGGSILSESEFSMLQKWKGGADDCGDLSGPHSYPPGSR